MLTRVTLVTLPAWLSVEAWESLGSWQSREAPDILVTFQALAVPGFTFPSLMSSSSGKSGWPRVAHTSFGAFQAKQEAIWSRGAWRPGCSWETWSSISSRWATEACRDAWLSYEALRSHLTRKASQFIFTSGGPAWGAWWAGIPWLSSASWLPVCPWESWISSGTFG